METGIQSARVRRFVLFGLFFVSGAAALVYQTAWHRLLGLFAGADAIAAALVVGAFLLGLGLGSLSAGLYADRLSRRAALIAFALCEVGIALFAVLSSWLYYDVIYRGLLPLASSRGVIFAVVFAGLLWPTFLMGCSLPFLSKAIVHHIAGSAQLIGWLYGFNTLGAGVGAFLGGWFLIGTFGFDKTIYIGAALNLMVAAGGLLLARGVDMAGGEARPKAVRLSGAGDGTVWRWSLLVFVSGFLIVAFQIVWYRLIGVLLQSNSYSFSLVLTVFLLGDAAGLLVGARVIDRISDPRRFFFLMQGIATMLALCGAWFVYFAIGAGVFHSSFVDYDWMAGTRRDAVVIAFLLSVVVLPASFIMGFSFPVVQKVVQIDIDRLGSRVGLVQLANILGNSAGSLVAGLLLLDLIGTAATLKLLAAIGLGFSILLIVGSRWASWAYVPASVLVAGLVLFPDGESFWRRLHGVGNEKAIVAEDKTGVSLLKLADAQSGRLYIQGHTQSQLPFTPVHTFLGAVGPLVHGAPRRVLVIGSGTGGTPYAAGINPATERVRVIEIVAPVIDILRRYSAQGGRAGSQRTPGGSKVRNRRRRWAPYARPRSNPLRRDRGRRNPAQERIVRLAQLTGILPPGADQARTGRDLCAVGADRPNHRDVPLGFPLRHNGSSGAGGHQQANPICAASAAGQRQSNPLRARKSARTAGAARVRSISGCGACRPRQAAGMVRRSDAFELWQGCAGNYPQHRFFPARRILPQPSLTSSNICTTHAKARALTHAACAAGRSL